MIKSSKFEITKEEYDSFDTVELDDLAETLREEGIYSGRFLFSDKNEENDLEHLRLRDIAFGKEWRRQRIT